MQKREALLLYPGLHEIRCGMGQTMKLTFFKYNLKPLTLVGK